MAFRRGLGGTRSLIRITAGIATAVRECGATSASSSARQVGGRFSLGGRGCPPTSVSRIILHHFRRISSSSHRGQGRIVIGIEAIFFDFLLSFLLGSFSLFAFLPEVEQAKDN